MEAPKPARPFERLARLRALDVESARQQFAEADAHVQRLRVERRDAKKAQRENERRAGCGILRQTGEGSTAALEAVLNGLRTIEAIRARLRAAKATREAARESLERHRAGERAAQRAALERTHALIRWREQRDQERAEEDHRARRFIAEIGE